MSALYHYAGPIRQSVYGKNLSKSPRKNTCCGSATLVCIMSHKFCTDMSWIGSDLTDSTCV